MPLVLDRFWLPATLTAPPMTDAEFSEFCANNPEYFIEMIAGGQILIMIMPPNHSPMPRGL